MAGCVTDSAASVCLVDEPIFFAVKSEPVRGSAVAAGLVNEPNYSAVKPVGEAQFEAAVGSLAELGFALAVAIVGEPCSASVQLEPQAEMSPVGEKQAEEDLKCLERGITHYEDS